MLSLSSVLWLPVGYAHTAHTHRTHTRNTKHKDAYAECWTAVGRDADGVIMVFNPDDEGQ